MKFDQNTKLKKYLHMPTGINLTNVFTWNIYSYLIKIIHTSKNLCTTLNPKWTNSISLMWKIIEKWQLSMPLKNCFKIILQVIKVVQYSIHWNTLNPWLVKGSTNLIQLNEPPQFCFLLVCTLVTSWCSVVPCSQLKLSRFSFVVTNNLKVF